MIPATSQDAVLESEFKRQALRIQEILEEGLDQHSASDPRVRGDALETRLRQEFKALAPGARQGVAEAMMRLLPVAAQVTSAAGFQEAAHRRRIVALEADLADARSACARLEHENERLKSELAETGRRLEAQPAAPVAAASEPTAAKPDGAIAAGSDPTRACAAAIADALAGHNRAVSALVSRDPHAIERMVGIVQAVAEFVGGLGGTFFGASAEQDLTVTGGLRSMITEEISGKVAAGSVKRLIDQLRAQIGSQILAFREASETGVQQVLRQIAPAAISHRVEQEGKRALARRIFFYQECWEAYERKHEELRTSDGIYEAYFDGAYRRALYRHLQER